MRLALPLRRLRCLDMRLADFNMLLHRRRHMLHRGCVLDRHMHHRCLGLCVLCPRPLLLWRDARGHLGPVVFLLPLLELLLRLLLELLRRHFGGDMRITHRSIAMVVAG